MPPNHNENAEKVEHKGLETSFEIKDETKGELEAVIATFDVVDRDGDIVRKSAIPVGSVVALSKYGHSVIYGDAPVGKGTVVIEGNRAIVKGQLFMDLQDAKDALTVIKGMGKDQQWSWGFKVLGAEMPSDDERKQGAYRILTKTETFEASPVIRGAGIGTRTVSAKAKVEEPVPIPVHDHGDCKCAAGTPVEECNALEAAFAKAMPIFDMRVARVLRLLKK